MSKDIYALETNKTWISVQLPSGKVSTDCNWVYKIKYKVDGSFGLSAIGRVLWLKDSTIIMYRLY